MFWNYFDVNNPANNRQPELVAAAAKNKDNSFVVGLVNLSGIHAQHFYSRYYASEAKIFDVTVNIDELTPDEVAVFEIQKTSSDGTYTSQGNTYLMKNKMKASVGSQSLVVLKATEIIKSPEVLLEEYRPITVEAKVFENRAVKVSWEDMSPNEDGFLIERRLKDGGTFVEAGTTAADVVEFTDETALTQGSVYEYRVIAQSSVTIGDKVFPDSLSSGIVEVLADFNVSTPFSLHTADIKAYPNPSKGIIRIESHTFNEKCLLEVYNITGSMVFSQITGMNQDIDLSGLPGGIYSVKVRNEKDFVILKLMIIE